MVRVGATLLFYKLPISLKPGPSSIHATTEGRYRRPPRSLVVALTVMAWLAGLSLIARAEQPAVSPRDVVMDATARFITELTARRDALRGDPAQANQLAEEHLLPLLDFRRFSRFVLGPHWRTASEGQRDRFVSEFRRFLVRTYTSAMADYVDEIISHANNIRYPPADWRPGDDMATVTLVIALNSGIEAEVQYRMHRGDGTWRIYDLAIEGISLAITYRSSYAQLIEKEGLDGLIQLLAAGNRAGGDSPVADAPHWPAPSRLPHNTGLDRQSDEAELQR